MFQISTMANFETEVYELLKLFLFVQVKIMMKRSAINALQLPQVIQAHDFLIFLTASLQDTQSHGFLGNIILKWNVSLLNKNRNVYCC